MPASKLTIADKEKIVQLYRETPASLSYLSEQFGISVSTVSRLLKEAIPEDEYRELVARKQAKRPRHKPQEITIPDTSEPPEPASPEPPLAQLELLAEIPPEIIEELQNIPIDDEFSAEEDIEEDEDEEEEDSEGDLASESLDLADLVPLKETDAVVQILPLDQAILPEMCYIVVDRAHEIVTRPLKAFRDLGIIPEEEAQSLTVPIFDSHRVVRRFCRPRQLIIKFPAALLYAARTKLIEKGITRLLVSGQVYALS
ncbi:MAG: hypothetical protein ACK4QL_11575 [Pseudanabaenaceae cyanobacterium]